LHISHREKLLSEAPKFSSTGVNAWLEHETGSIFTPVHARAQKLVDDVNRTLDSLSETSKTLLDNSAREIERRNMKTYKRARAMNKLARLFVDRTRQIRVPEKVTYDSLTDFVRETQKAFIATEIDIRNWFPRISPFFILDRRRFLTIFEKAKALLKELDGFLNKEYVKTKTLEDTFQLINRLSGLESQLKVLSERKARVEGDKASVEREIAETKQRIAELKTMGSVGQLSQTGTEIDALSVEIKHNLQHLQKPFIKLQSLASHGSGSGLAPDELKKLAQYLENPFEALSTEEEGHPLLKQILEKLHRSISEDKLKLKPEKARKAEQAINNILKDNSLISLHQRCRDTMSRRTRLSTSEEVAATQKDLTKLYEHVANLTRSRGVLEGEEHSVNRTYVETNEKIRTHKSEIEKNIFSFTSKRVTIT
jgi:hypothetical protein